MSASLYGPPPGVSVAEGLHLIFSHYCSPWKSNYAGTSEQDESQSKSMDGPSFARMCREAPELDKYIDRSEIDLIFSKTKPYGVRRLDYDHFLDTLMALAAKLYPEENPTIALANFLSRFIFALFDQPPSPAGLNIIEKILQELVDDPAELMTYLNP
jgi:hypothetical protein